MSLLLIFLLGLYMQNISRANEQKSILNRNWELIERPGLPIPSLQTQNPLNEWESFNA